MAGHPVAHRYRPIAQPPLWFHRAGRQRQEGRGDRGLGDFVRGGIIGMGVADGRDGHQHGDDGVSIHLW
jgi:hypothetical protein